MNALDAEFREWVSRVYGQTLQGDQASQIEMAFYAGVIASGVVMRQVGGVNTKTATPQCAAAMSEIGQSVMAHIARCMKSADVVQH